MVNMVLEGNYTAVQELLQSVAYTLVNRLILAVLMLLFGFIIGRVVGNFVARMLHEFELDKTLKNFTKINFSVESAISTFASFFIYFIAIVLTLQTLGVDTLIFNIIAFGVIAIIALSVILAIKDSVPNIIAGFFIFQKKFFKKGDKVKVKGITGIITELTFMEVKIQTAKDDVIFIPNSLFIKEEVTKLKK